MGPSLGLGLGFPRVSDIFGASVSVSVSVKKPRENRDLEVAPLGAAQRNFFAAWPFLTTILLTSDAASIIFTATLHNTGQTSNFSRYYPASAFYETK